MKALALTLLLFISALAATRLVQHIRFVKRRRQLQRLLSAQAVDFIEIQKGDAYGWPGYVLVFESEARKNAFKDSPKFATLLREVQAMHANLRGFEAERAVGLAPFVFREAERCTQVIATPAAKTPQELDG